MAKSKFLQCQRCKGFILLETSTAKRVHNVKCLSSRLQDSKAGVQNNSEIFQGFINIPFPRLTVAIRRLDNNEDVLRKHNNLKNKGCHDVKSHRGRKKGKSNLGVDLNNIITDSKRARVTSLRAKTNFKEMCNSDDDDDADIEEVKAVNILRKNIKRNLKQSRKSPKIYYDKSDKVSCPKCERFVHRSGIKRHLERHSNYKTSRLFSTTSKIECIVCQSYFSSYHALKKHFVAVHVKDNPFFCRFPGCSLKVGDYFTLERHVGKHIEENKLKCSNCENTFTKFDSLVSHGKICVKKGGTKKRTSVSAALYKRIPAKNFSKKDAESEFVEVKTEKVIEMESVHLVDKIVETEQGPVHIKGESLDTFSDVSNKNDLVMHVKQTEINSIDDSDNKDDDTESENGKEWDEEKIRDIIVKKIASWNDKLRNVEYINAIIKADPLFLKLEKENEEFTKLIIRQGGRKNYFAINKSKSYRCDICSRAFRRYYGLQNHKKQNVCNFMSKDSQNINTNGNISKPSDNDDAEKVTSTSKLSDQSLDFMCTGCGFQSTSALELEFHMKNSPEHNRSQLSKTHPCPKKCGGWFTSIQQLNEHIDEAHDKVPDVKCDKCDRFFTTKKSLHRHVHNKHSSPRIHPCSRCGRKFISKENSEMHAEKCSVRICKPKCLQCGEYFSNNHSLRRHVMRIHTNKYLPNDRNDSNVQSNGSRSVDRNHNANATVKTEVNPDSVEFENDGLNCMILGI